MYSPDSRNIENKTNNMQKQYLLITMAAVLAAPGLQAAYEGTVQFGSSRLFGTGPGGEFTLTVTAGLTEVVTDAQHKFQTFCLETGEYINFGGTYNANVNYKAVLGRTASSGDPLSWGTAWLYSQFRANTLANYATATYSHNASANALQDAIWWLEGEISGPVTSLSALAQLYITQAQTGTGKDAAHIVDTAPAYAYNVAALNLYDSSGNRAQDQLAIVPEPGTILAGALLVLPFCMTTLRAMRRKSMI